MKFSRPIRFLYLGLANAKNWLEEYKNDHDETLLQVLDSGFDDEAGTLGPAFTWNLTAGEIFLEAQGFKIDISSELCVSNNVTDVRLV